MNTAKAYTLSVWATNSSISVSGGATRIKSGPTYNGFTYYEYEIPEGTSSVSVTGSARIDELRLYPQNARMQTTSYDPLIGKTSECDQNNRITYYSYDNLGRLQAVKDESKNILKKYEYNEVSSVKRRGCPTTYYNHKITEVFTKNDCTSGTVPDTNLYTYTVPAEKYTSSVSQEEADIQAQVELLTDGQAQANANSNCIAIYYNNEVSITDTSQSCGPKYKSGEVTYTVPAGVYSSFISQTDADAMAMVEAKANVRWYTDHSDHKACVVDYDPDWEWEEGDPTDCRAVGAETHKFYQMTDENPNSSTFHQTQWVDSGNQGDCSTLPPANFTLYIANGTNKAYDITLYNNATSVSYSYTNVTHSKTVYNFPSGTYDVYLTPDNSDPSAYTTFVAGCADPKYTDGETYVYFYGVELNSQCNTISIYH